MTNNLVLEMRNLQNETDIAVTNLKDTANEVSTQKIKVKKGTIALIKENMQQIKNEFYDKYDDFKNAFNDSIKLKKEYVKDVKACCDFYKDIKTQDEEVGTKIEKGYRQQVRLIQAILSKMKNIIQKYKDSVPVVDQMKNDLDSKIGYAGLLAERLSA